MAEPISIQQLKDASLDVKSLEEVVNGDDAKQVETRLGESYPSVKKAIKTLFEAGGLPATPFATKALMTASELVDGDYAMVTDNASNNGLYVKTAGAWVKSGYDPVKQSKDYVDNLATVSPHYLGTPHHLDDLKSVGTYVSTLTALATVENGYPRSGGAYYIEVTTTPNSSATWQVAYSSAGENYNRFWNGTVWSEWRKIDYEKGSDFSIKSVLKNTQNLNEIFEAGAYLQNAVQDALPELGYPVEKTGVLTVYTHPASGAAFQTYTHSGGFWFRQGAKTTGYGIWNLLAGGESLYKTNQYNSREVIYEGDDINNFKDDGYYIRMNGTRGINFPSAALGVLTVRTHSRTSFVQQEFTQYNGVVLCRFWDSYTWSEWRSGSVLVDAKNTLNLQEKLDPTKDWDEINQSGIYIKNTLGGGLNSAPLNSYGTLSVYAPSFTTLKTQQFISADGAVAVRTGTANGWGAWSINNPTISNTTAAAALSFTKTENNLTFENPMPNGSLTRTVFGRTTREDINLDNWGINACTAVTPEKTIRIVSSGVWETAIVDKENISDHSGGGHGDEVLSEAYFMVDGVYYPQDFVLTGSADMIEFYQKSTIFVEATSTVLCHKVLKWTFTRDKYNLKQWFEFPSERTLNTAWISMLPVMRKSNSDNTGDQITDTEIRSQDMRVIDASEPDFEKRDLPISNGDSITLSSAISGISTRLTVNEIQATEEPQAFVQNTAVYNKIYISGIPIGVSTTIPANSNWYIDSDFSVKVL